MSIRGALTNIGSDTNRAALESNQRRLATGATTTARLSVVGIQSAAKGIVDRLGNHHGSGNIRLDIKDSARLLEDLRQLGVTFCWVASM